ncbi:hypothetical protein [Ruminococcus sp. NK3A76]|uniref:hypothetical protein n=1 Tax=Ruminococcus sp. NK3A76 TaxID=877411 RepID=UPI0004918964|nr:hypothetical protein [Ruminococcus sp. NK3A76]
MKGFSRKRKNRIKTLVLCAALAFTFAADSVSRPFSLQAFGSDKSTPADAEDGDDTEQVDAAVSSDILKDVYGSIEFWRWERVGKNNYPRDDKEHLAMFVFGQYYDYNGISVGDIGSLIASTVCPGVTLVYNAVTDSEKSAVIYDSKMFSALAPRDIWVGPSANAVPGVPSGNLMENSGEYGTFVGTGNNQWGDSIREQYAHYIKMDTTYRDPGQYMKYGVDTSEDLFFTTSDMNTVFIKYAGASAHVDGVDGKDSPMYTIRLKSSNKTNYYLNATDKSNESLPYITTKESEAGKWTFRSSEDPNRGVLYRPVIFDKGNDDEGLATRNTGFVFTLDDSDGGYSSDKCKLFIGTKMRFSALKGTTTIRSGQILSVSANDYVTSSGDIESQNGIMLKNGDKIVIEKGGILSIEGNLINNGTIENRGGTILIKNGGNIFPFQQGTSPASNGCGTIKCIGGDIIIQEGGALYAGLSDENGALCPFQLDESSVLINQGLLVYGTLRLGNGARVELYEDSKTYGSFAAKSDVGGAVIEIPPQQKSWTVKYKFNNNGTYSEMTLNDYIYLNYKTQDDELYSEYRILFDDKDTPLEKKQEFADKLQSESKEKIEIVYAVTYGLPDNGVTTDFNEMIRRVESYGFSFVKQKDDGTLCFAQYSFKAKFYDLLSNNNASFLMGNLSAVKFLTAAKGLAGMYKWEDSTKDPVVLKVDSAYLNDDNMITDKSKTGYIEVGKLTI